MLDNKTPEEITQEQIDAAIQEATQKIIDDETAADKLAFDNLQSDNNLKTHVNIHHFKNKIRNYKDKFSNATHRHGHLKK